MNENLGELFAALAMARQEFGTLTKGKSATIKSDKGSYGYAYADLSDVIEATAAALAKHGLVVIQEPEVVSDGGRQLVVVNGCIAHKSGAIYQLRPLALPVAGGTAQSIGSAITFARRYQLSAVLNLAAADDDGSEASTAQDAPRGNSSATKTTLKAQSGTIAPRRTVDAGTGEIVEPVTNGNGNGAHADNPFVEVEPLYYAAVWQKLTGAQYDLVDWIQQLHRNTSGECSKAQYGLVTGTVDALTKDEHNYALSVLCQSEISKENMPSKDAASALLKFLQKTIKDEEGNKIPNPKYRQDMADMVTYLAAQRELEEQAEPQPEPEVAV